MTGAWGSVVLRLGYGYVDRVPSLEDIFGTSRERSDPHAKQCHGEDTSRTERS